LKNLAESSFQYSYSATCSGHSARGIYDAASQLINETRPGYNVFYTFDGNGNRLSKTVNGAPEYYAYDDGDKMLSQGQYTYTYDTAGRRTQKLGLGGAVLQTYSYDAEDRLTATGNQTFQYNGFNTRVSKIVGGVFTPFHRDGTGVTASLISEGGSTITPGTSIRTSAANTYLHGGLKDVSAQSNSTNQISGSKVYDAYGATLNSTGSWVGRLGFGGQFGSQTDAGDLEL
jgi:YD repeat-containing protein